jgi:RNA recognition motif-containing protein
LCKITLDPRLIFTICIDNICSGSESTSIPTNPRTSRPVGYAFVDLSTPSEAERAITELNGQSILDRKVSVQLAKKPEAHENGETNGEARRRPSTRGRGRGRGRAGRASRGGRSVSTYNIALSKLDLTEPEGHRCCNWRCSRSHRGGRCECPRPCASTH